jgi:hypothetical protein
VRHAGSKRYAAQLCPFPVERIIVDVTEGEQVQSRANLMQ